MNAPLAIWLIGTAIGAATFGPMIKAAQGRDMPNEVRVNLALLADLWNTPRGRAAILITMVALWPITIIGVAENLWWYATRKRNR